MARVGVTDGNGGKTSESEGGEDPQVANSGSVIPSFLSFSRFRGGNKLLGNLRERERIITYF